MDGMAEDEGGGGEGKGCLRNWSRATIVEQNWDSAKGWKGLLFQRAKFSR